MGRPAKRERHPVSLILPLTLFPFPAWAEVCDKIRPGWTPGTQVTQAAEALHLFSTAPALILIAASLIAVVKRSAWGALVTVLLWSLLVSGLTLFADKDIQGAAASEGCIASPTLFIAAVTAICIAMILYTLPRDARL